MWLVTGSFTLCILQSRNSLKFSYNSLFTSEYVSLIQYTLEYNINFVYLRLINTRKKYSSLQEIYIICLYKFIQGTTKQLFENVNSLYCPFVFCTIIKMNRTTTAKYVYFYSYVNTLFCLCYRYKLRIHDIFFPNLLFAEHILYKFCI